MARYSELRTTDICDISQFIYANVGSLSDSHISIRKKDDLYIAELSSANEPST